MLAGSTTIELIVQNSNTKYNCYNRLGKAQPPFLH